MNIHHDLSVLLRSQHPLIVMDTQDEARARQTLELAAATNKIPCWEWTITKGLRRLGSHPTLLGSSGRASDEALKKIKDPIDLLVHMRDTIQSGLFLLTDFSKHLTDHAAIRQFREILQMGPSLKRSVVLLGTEITLPPELKGKAAHFDLGLPDQEELRRLILTTLDHHRQGGRITVNLDAPSLDKFIGAFSGLSSNQARQVLNFCIFDDQQITADDIRLVSQRKARLIQDGGLVEYFPPPDHQFELGGFKNLKAWLKRTKIAFNPEYAQKYNLSFPKGLLLLGVQGCGKSLAAKFIAQDMGLPLLKLNSGSLFDKYIGETEKNFQRIIKMAETLAPVVLWIDEIEKVLVNGDGGGDDQAVSRRLLGVILSWLQEKKSPIFVVATANQIHALPPELQRKGRFDEIFYVDLPDQGEREDIFRIHCKLRHQTPQEADIKHFATSAEGYTGSEIEQVIIAALHECLHETKETKDFANFLLRELLQTIPLSVSRKEEVDEMRTYLRERYVPVK